MSSYQYAISATTPQFIPVADKPLSLGGKIEHLTPGEFQKRFGCPYHEGISIDSHSRIGQFRENITTSLSAAELKKRVEKVLMAASENLVICKMGELGHGIFTSKDIPKDTVVAIYSGTIMAGNKYTSKEDHPLGYYEADFSFSMKRHRGIATFMQHLPEVPLVPDPKIFSQILKMTGQNVSEEQIKLNIEFYRTDFDSTTTKERVATENIRREFLDFNKIPVIAMVADRHIKAGEQLGFNYGYEYWLSRKITPEFFDKSGSILSHHLYKRTFGRLNFNGFSYTGAYRPLIESLGRGVNSFKVVDDGKKSHQVSFGELLSILLEANGCRLEINPVYKQALLGSV